MKKRGLIIGLALLAGIMTGCGSESRGNSSASASALQYSESSEKITLNLAAAASLKNVFDEEIIPMFEEEHKNIDVTRQIARDRALLGMPEMELNHVICLDDEDMDACLPRADEYQVWYAEADIGQNKMVRISDTENVTMLHTGYIINKNMKKGYPLKENLEPSGDHISRYNDNFYLI